MRYNIFAKFIGVVIKMNDWIFPSVAFVIFLYGMTFLVAHLHNYTKSDMSLFDSNGRELKYDDMGRFLKDISESFK